jgi:hypothetical protein
MTFTAFGYLAGRLWPYAAAAAVAGLAWAWIVFGYGAGREDEGYQRGHAEFLELHATTAAAARQAERTQRDEEQRRVAAQRANDERTEQALQKARADVAIADATADRLRQRIEALVASARSGQAGGGATPGSVGPPTEDAAGVLADVLGRCIARVQLLAAVADERGERGAACERSYDSLTTP